MHPWGENIPFILKEQEEGTVDPARVLCPDEVSASIRTELSWSASNVTLWTRDEFSLFKRPRTSNQQSVATSFPCLDPQHSSACKLTAGILCRPNHCRNNCQKNGKKLITNWIERKNFFGIGFAFFINRGAQSTQVQLVTNWVNGTHQGCNLLWKF